MHFDPALPINARRDEIRAAIDAHPIVIVCGETGSGKTTQLPKILLERDLASGAKARRIGHTQPRRIAARSVAARIAEELGTELGDRLGGHLVSGHIDGIGEVSSFAEGVLRIRAPRELARYVARKGSICVDGVSLTVNKVEGDTFEVFLIPHTQEVTTLGRLAAGAKVNLEVDLVARYLERLLADRG